MVLASTASCHPRSSMAAVVSMASSVDGIMALKLKKASIHGGGSRRRPHRARASSVCRLSRAVGRSIVAVGRSIGRRSLFVGLRGASFVVVRFRFVRFVRSFVRSENENEFVRNMTTYDSVGISTRLILKPE